MDMDRILAAFERFMAVITTPGRKGSAFDRGLIGILGVTVLMYASDGGLSADEGEVAIAGITWALGVFSGTNVGEHFAKRGGTRATPGTSPGAGHEPVAAGVAGFDSWPH